MTFITVVHWLREATVASMFITGIVASLGGVYGFLGLQTKKSQYIRRYYYLKLIQIVAELVISLVLMLKADQIASDAARERIEIEKEAAAATGKPVPDIDEKKLTIFIHEQIFSSNLMNILLITPLMLYFAGVIKSLGAWYQIGADPSQARFLVAAPDSTGRVRIHYETPLLHGQDTQIPVAAIERV